MKAIFTLIFTCAFFTSINVNSQENAAPSMYLNCTFPSNDAILKMRKIKITQTAPASFFEVNYFTGGYSGLQDTDDLKYGTSNILISSLWDSNTAAGIYSKVEFNDISTQVSRFGGEGDGSKTINPYKWKLNQWYNLVQRCWKFNGRLYIATFINDISTGTWFHTATISNVDPGQYLFSRNGAFLENWIGYSANRDGRNIRKAFYKDSWNINTSGNWEKDSRRWCEVNNSQGDIARNGIYNNSFNSGYDTTENAYFMVHGGNTTPSPAFNGTKTLELPQQVNQGNLPEITIGEITAFTAIYTNNITSLDWIINSSKTPQLSSKIEIINPSGATIKTIDEIKPQKRKALYEALLEDGIYTAKLTMTDIFNQTSIIVANFNVGTLGIDELSFIQNEIKVYPNPASSTVTVEGEGMKSLSIIDATGKVMLTQLIEKKINIINIETLSSGSYIFSITNTENKLITKNLIKK